MLRILHVGLGPLGRRVLEDLHDRGLGRVVGAVDPARGIAGKRLASLVPAAGPGKVLARLEEFRAWKQVDCALVTTTSDLRLCADTFRVLLSKGLTVVSTCEELVWPWLRHARLAAELDALARRRGGRLLGTGVNPGFVMDALPLFASAICSRVESVEVHRIQDASTRRIPFQQKIGVGLEEREFVERVIQGTLRHVGLGESLHMIAHELGFTIDHWDEELRMVRARAARSSPLGRIRKGRCAGVRQVASGYQGSRRVIRLVFQAALGQRNPHDRVVIQGDPPVDLILRGGVHGDTATSGIVLNAIRSLRSAPPGLRTMASLPLVSCARGS